MSGSWSNTVPDLILLIEDISGFSGLFGYSPTIGPGNLVFSVAAAAGTDPYGNDYKEGITVYDPAGSYIRLVAGAGSAQEEFSPPAVTGVTWQPGGMSASLGSRLGTNTPSVGIGAPYNTAFASRATISLFGNPQTSNGDVTNEIVMSTFRVTITGKVLAANLQSATVPVSFVALSSFTQAVVFPEAYDAGVVPTVTTNIESGAGNTARWQSRAISVTNTGFTLFVFKGDAGDPAQTWSNIPVQWWAHGV